ncbi:PAS domain-containing sensor histidine kinase [Aestuariibaculum lutulentum]|uniref:histidine kinase n=1 Tax=Aestuariibaculum lutulentum TaxID=2920935 RepID=A0ABS9RMV3_9FLAO|nr:PAS domain-containing sensor histidine kinase [Aestuariibaculum lutulentum]MCH4553886.1 PAS domain S-box protein [Aestuariibaculum lutulentum]
MFHQDQEIFNILLETVSEGVVIVDSHQILREVNAASEAIFGYSREELIGKPLNVLIPSNYHINHHNYFQRFIEEGKRRKMTESADIYGLKKDGTIFPIDIELNPFKSYNQNFVIALINDISKRKEVEKNLMLRTQALESAKSGIFITDALKQDNPIIYFNSSFQNLTGYPEEEILNHNFRFLLGKDTKQEAIKKLNEALQKGESCQTTIRNYRKDGSMFWNDLYIFPITNSRGVVSNFVGIQNDVTTKKIAEEERLHLATIFDESLNEIYVFDAHTLKFVNANYGAQKNIGYSLEELKAMTPLDLTKSETESNFRKTIKSLLKKDIEKLEFESIHKRKDGSEYPIEVHLQLSRLNEMDVLVAIILDITERKNYTTNLENQVEERTKQLEKALNKEKELNELKTSFLSLVSHEFKTPLSAILTSCELLNKYQLEEQQDKRNKHIKTVVDKVHFLNNILNDFLSVEKLETGKVNYRFSDFKLSKVINEAVYDANMHLKEGQQIKYPENIDDLSIYQDEKIIQLILSNLLYNAIKYSHESTSIELIVKQDNNTTTIKVIDQGIGIPEKDQKHIFERYFRAENVLNTQGTGIGLNIVKNHLENLGGSICFETKEDIGSTFIITFPNTATP